MWLAADKPLFGVLFENKNKDKLRYKHAISKAKRDSAGVITDKLHESLIDKNTIAFWKTWNTKISNKNKSKIVLEGNPDQNTAAEQFSKFFQTVFTPNPSRFNIDKQDEFEAKINTYSDDRLKENDKFTPD